MTNLTKEFSMTIKGKGVFTTDTLPVINPANESVIAKVPNAGLSDLNNAVQAAREAFPSWSNLSVEERAAKLEEFAEAFYKQKDELAKLFTLEMGRPLKASYGEIKGAYLNCKEIASQRLPRTIIEDTEHHYVEQYHTPLGVAGLIVPWNFPVLLAIWKIAPALLTGNTVVVKPSPNTPLTALLLGEISRDIFPPGVLNVVSGGNELGQWMTEHSGINKISFTGSTATGKKVMQSASTNLKRITLELGGNDASIVLEDADPKKFVKPIFWAAFSNTAQVCIAAKRLYVHEKIYDEFLTEFVNFAKSVKIGDGMDQDSMLGPVQNKMQYEKVKELIEDTKRSGANIVCGGEVPEQSGYFIPITIVDNPPEDSRVVVEEAFGPILPILKYSDYDEVIERANNSSYGLGGTIWGQDINLAKSIAERLETGSVWINEAQILAPKYPFGGHKESGLGVEHSLAGLAEYTNSKTILIRK